MNNYGKVAILVVGMGVAGGFGYITGYKQGHEAALPQEVIRSPYTELYKHELEVLRPEFSKFRNGYEPQVIGVMSKDNSQTLFLEKDILGRFGNPKRITTDHFGIRSVQELE